MTVVPLFCAKLIKGPHLVHEHEVSSSGFGRVVTVFNRYGTEIKLDGEDYIIMREEEVLGILTGAAKKETVGANSERCESFRNRRC